MFNQDPMNSDVAARILTTRGHVLVGVILIGSGIAETIMGMRCGSGWIFVTALSVCTLIPPACFFIPIVSRFFIKSDASDKELDRIIPYGIGVTLILFVLAGGSANALLDGRPIKGLAPDCTRPGSEDTRG